MEPCCDKMRELVAQAGKSGVSARLPASPQPRPWIEEQPPALVFRSLAKGQGQSFDDEGESLFPLLVESTEFINFCPFCGRDWRVASVSEALSVLTLSAAQNEARRPKAVPSADP